MYLFLQAYILIDREAESLFMCYVGFQNFFLLSQVVNVTQRLLEHIWPLLNLLNILRFKIKEAFKKNKNTIH